MKCQFTWKQPFIILFNILLLVCSMQLKAGHIVGGQISYTYQSFNNYEVILQLYRDCNGSEASDNPAYVTIRNEAGFIINPNGSFGSGGAPIYNPVIAPIETEVDPCFSDLPDICLEQNTYTFDITLPQAAGIYTLTFQRCCRNANITNIFEPENTGTTFEIEIPHNTLGFNNTSAVFNNPPAPIICLNTPVAYDHSAYDADGDSLVYSFYTPFDGASTAIPYPTTAGPYGNIDWVAPYSENDPIGGSPPLSIDPQTGLLTGDPEDFGRYVAGVQVTEYRDGQAICVVRRDFQFNITDCESVGITTGGGAVLIGPNEYQVNECDFSYGFEETNLFSINDQNVSLEWILSEPDEGVINYEGDSLNPVVTYTDVGTYEMIGVATIPNNSCADTVTIILNMYPILDLNFDYELGDCGDFTVTFAESTDNPLYNEWSWNFGDPNVSPLANTSNNENPSHTYSAPGTYFVSLSVGNEFGCEASLADYPIVIPEAIQTSVESSHLEICSGDTITLTGNYQGVPLGESIEFMWEPTNQFPNSDGPIQLVTPQEDTWYVFSMEVGGDCITRDSVFVEVLQRPVVTLSEDVDICEGASTQLEASITGDYDAFLWSHVNTLSANSLNPIATPPDTLIYILQASNEICFTRDSMTVSVIHPVEILANEDVIICEGDSIRLDIEVLNGENYVWSPTDGINNPYSVKPTTAPNETTTYTVTISNDCFISTDDMIVFVDEKPIIEAGEDLTTPILDPIPLEGFSSVPDAFWSPPFGLFNPNDLNTLANPDVHTTYYLEANNGVCNVIDSVTVFVDKSIFIKVVTAFTPNGDGLHDSFGFKAQGITFVEAFAIYNRWGEEIFRDSGFNARWDGTFKNQSQPMGTYIYYIQAEDIEGNPFVKQGNVTLIR